ncbi:MAG: polysaccharide biosynthesis protein [Clostridia bacterium]|nr:polysaccharide biosynthesis protein [Clostridia bacterium]
MKKNSVFIYNAFILIAVSLIMRTVGMYFNVYISNRIGAEAMGVHSLIGGVYNFGITLATSGINLAVTRLISEAQGKGQAYKNGKIMRTCIGYALIFGIAAASLLFALSETIAYRWLDDARCTVPLRILALSLPPIAITSALNGYFTARRQVIKNALTVFIEQGVRISVTVMLLTSILPEGIEYACIALALGSTAAELGSLIIMSLMYMLQSRKTQAATTSSHEPVARTLCGISLPVAFSSYVRSGLLTVEHALIPLGLKKFGADTVTSLSLYGALQSMALPVILFPAVFITSFSGLLVPEIAESRAAQNNTHVKSIQRRTLRLTLLFSIGVSGIMLFFSNELGSALYPDTPDAGRFIALLAPLIPVMYLDSMTDVMLKGMGQQFYSMMVNIADALLSVVLVWFLLPRYGIYSYIAIIYICELLNAALSVSRLLYISRIKPNMLGWVFKPLVAVTGSVSIVRLIFSLTSGYTTATSLTWAIVCCALIYLLLLRGLYALERDDFKKLRRFVRSS